ncbi:hypothetical protein [Bacillus massilinigeriensis]|uniref:hypothetical protein n=1 Tax=Bacillus mediterraneensis TaxID=1805474 RepID=UPI0008F81C00|nr:hypothetical protein [Bacillus mediterraneensis]
MEFNIMPYIGVGKIHLGMTSDEVQTALNSKAEKFRKFDDDECETDSFEWCHVFYKKSGVCEAIELFAPAFVIFNGEYLIGKSFSKVKDFVSQFDEKLQIDESGFTSLKLGFGVYAPFAESEPLEPVEGVIVFEKDYYN